MSQASRRKTHASEAAGRREQPGPDDAIPQSRPVTGTDGTAARIVCAGTADAEALSQVIADAFCDLPPSRWLIPDEADRHQILPAYFRLPVEHALAHGIVYTTADRAATALWLAAGEQPPVPPAGYGGRLRAVTGPWTSRFLVFDAALGQHHPAGIAHHHLAMLAVRPARQNQGLGTALLDAHHVVLDSAGLPAYLEAADLRTRGVYLRRGYADLGRPIRLPDGPLMYPMLREPHGDGAWPS